MGFVVEVEKVKWCGDGSSSLELGVSDGGPEAAVSDGELGCGNEDLG
jgi:hypothetical protein